MIDLSRNAFDENLTYQAYKTENIFKSDSKSLINTLETIKKMNSSDRILIELPNTIGLTREVIANIPNNVDIRIIGGLTDEYSKSYRDKNMGYSREKSTYSKEELESIIAKIEKIESGIDPNWNKYEIALYLYEYMKADITYRKPNDIGPDGQKLDMSSNTYRTRTWDTLTGLINEISTCNGYAHIYQELCTRQGIECNQIGGKYLSENEGAHAWNLVTINNQTFIVDIIWDSMEYEKGKNQTTGFGTVNTKMYKPQSYKEKHSEIISIDPKWINSASSKVSINVPKENLSKEKIERFLKLRELDRQRMLQLINSKEIVIEEPIGGFIR